MAKAWEKEVFGCKLIEYKNQAKRFYEVGNCLGWVENSQNYSKIVNDNQISFYTHA